MARERTCLYCRQAIRLEDAITACPRCGALYHEGCWSSVSTCASPACLAGGSASPQEGGETRPLDAPSAGEAPSREGAEALVALYGGEAFPMEPSGEQPAKLPLERRVASLVRTALPLRIKGGEFGERAIYLDTSAGRAEVPWDRVELLCLGIIEEDVGSPRESRSGLRNMVRKLFFGEDARDNEPRKKVRDTYLLDVYVSDQQAPYRFDAGTVNYRSVLGRVSYISQDNFSRFLASVAWHCRESRLDGSVVGFLTGRRERIKRHVTIYDFELESARCRDRLEEQTPRQEVEIQESLLTPRTSPDPETWEPVGDASETTEPLPPG